MTRKRFVKLLMANGVHRNAANRLAKDGNPRAAAILGWAAKRHQITNCTETKDGPHFKLKPREVQA